MPDFNLQRFASEIAARHRIRLAIDDPAMVIVTLNQLLLEETIKTLGNYVDNMQESIDNAGRKVERRAGLVLSQEVRESASALRQELQKDIDTASLRMQKIVDDLHKAHSNGSLYCSWHVGLVCVVSSIGSGILIGWNLHRMMH